MQNLDSIFLDRLEIKGREKPKLWAPHKNQYVNLIDLNENYIILERNGIRNNMPRCEEAEQTLLWPSENCSDWNNWRKYLFEDKVDFIAPQSYIMKGGKNHIHLSQTICKLPYLVVEVESGKVVNAVGDILTVDINKYRFASQGEIDGFFDVANNCGCAIFAWSKIVKTYGWYYIVHNKKPKFLPGDLVALKDSITGDIFEGYYIVSDIIDCGKGLTKTFKYKLISDSFYSTKLIEVIVDEDKLIKCSVVIEKEEPEIEIGTTEKPQEENIKEDKKKDYFLL